MRSLGRWARAVLFSGTVLVLTTVVVSAAHAEFQVQDPNGTFAELKRSSMTPVTPFSVAMACGQKRTFTATDARCEYRCSTMFCQSRCEAATGFEAKFDFHIEECTADGVSLFGDNGLSLAISRKEYEDDGTWLRALLRSSGQFIQPEGTWTLLNTWMGRASMIEGGKLIPLSNVVELQLELSFGPAGTQTERYFMLLDQNKVGLDQVLAFGEGSIPDPKSMLFLSRRGLVIPIRGGGGLFP